MKPEEMTNAQRSAAGLCYECLKPYANAHVGLNCTECWLKSLGDLAQYLQPKDTNELGDRVTTE